MPRLQLPMTVAVRKQETRVLYQHESFNMPLQRLKCQLDIFLQESDTFITNDINGGAYSAERNCEHNLVLIL